MEKKLKNIHITIYSLFIAKDCWCRSLSSLVNNLSKGIHRIKCKHGYDHKKYET